MPARPEPYLHAVEVLRERLREGSFTPGMKIAANSVAATLRLSTTPVREALSRLAGEGLLDDRRGQGFFVHVLTSGDVSDLYRLSQAILFIAQDPRRPLRRSVFSEASGDPIGDVEQLFSDWVEEAGSRVLISLQRTLALQLGPVRRAEPEVLLNLDGEAAELRSLIGPDVTAQRLVALRRFHGRRIALADRLALAVGRGQPSAEV